MKDNEQIKHTENMIQISLEILEKAIESGDINRMSKAHTELTEYSRALDALKAAAQ